MNKRKLMAMALAASIAVGGVATPFTSFATNDNSGVSTDKPVTSTDTEGTTADVSTDVKEKTKALNDLRDQIAKVDYVNRAKNTEDSLQKMDQALLKAKAASDDPDKFTTSEINTLAQNLKNALNNLVAKDNSRDNGNESTEAILKQAKAELLANMERGKKYLDDQNFTKESRDKLALSIKDGTAIYSNSSASVDSVKAASKTVFNAIYNLKRTTSNNDTKELKKELLANMERGKKYLQDRKYTKDSRATLEASIKRGAEVYNNSNSSAEDIKAANKTVFNAIYNLELSKADNGSKELKKELLANMKRGKKYLDDQRYTKDSREKLSAAIKRGAAIYNDEKSSSESVKAANKAVFDAIYHLKLVAPIKDTKEAKRELMANIERGKEYLDQKMYTKASRGRLEKAIKAGLDVYNSKDADLNTVLAANKRVAKSIYNLQLVDGKTPSKETRKDKKERKVKKGLPQTGVESMSAVAIAAAALVGAGVIAAKKRK